MADQETIYIDIGKADITLTNWGKRTISVKIRDAQNSARETTVSMEPRSYQTLCRSDRLTVTDQNWLEIDD